MTSANTFKLREQVPQDAARRQNDRRLSLSPFGGIFNALRPLIQ